MRRGYLSPGGGGGSNNHHAYYGGGAGVGVAPPYAYYFAAGSGGNPATLGRNLRPAGASGTSAGERGNRVRVLVAVLVVVLVGLVVREREAQTKALALRSRLKSLHEDSGPFIERGSAAARNALASGMRLVNKLKTLDRNSVVNSLGAANHHAYGNDKDEEGLFDALQAETEEADDLSKRDVEKMLEEGVLELPHVDREDDDSDDNGDGEGGAGAAGAEDDSTVSDTTAITTTLKDPGTTVVAVSDADVDDDASVTAVARELVREEIVRPTEEEIRQGEVKIIPVKRSADGADADEEAERVEQTVDDEDEAAAVEEAEEEAAAGVEKGGTTVTATAPDAHAAAPPPTDEDAPAAPTDLLPAPATTATTTAVATATGEPAKPLPRLLPQVKQASTTRYFKMVTTHYLALVDAWTHAGWKRLSEHSSITSATLLLTKPVTVVFGSRGKMISQISSSSCIGGTKGAQLSCRSKFAQSHGCAFDADLKVSPRQFDMWRSADCERFFDFALSPENANKQWIGKLGASYHGRHITIYNGVPKSVRSHYGKCKLNKETGGGYIMQEYVSDPALIGGRKFDLRTFMLIASTEPFLVFYHRGFVRRSATAYSSTSLNDKLAHITNHASQSSDDHFASFGALEQALASEMGFAPDYLRTTFSRRAKAVTNFVFQSARTRLKRRAGAYMLFGLDWMIDRSGGVHLLEANGAPLLRHYPFASGEEALTPGVWRDMASLLTTVHLEPDKIVGELSVRSGFTFGGWELVFSELEEKAHGAAYNPCSAEAGLR